jgi:hypothetical protein
MRYCHDDGWNAAIALLSDRHRAAAMIAGHGRYFRMGIPKPGAKANFYGSIVGRAAGGGDKRT